MGTMEEQILAITGGQQVPPQQTEPVVDEEVIVNEEVDQQIADEPNDADIEQKARDAGWNPDYNGRNKKTAKEFLEVGEKVAPLILKDKKRLEQENEILRKSHESLMKASSETIKKLKEDNEKRIQELETTKKTARENLDTETLEKAINEQNTIRQDQQKLEQTAPQVDPAVQLWAQQNSDFVTKVQSDPGLERHAESIALSRREELLKYAPAERFQKVMEQLIQERPDKFSNPNQQQAPRTLTMARTQTPAQPAENKLSISTLPKDERAAYDLIVKAKGFKTPDAKKAFDEMYLEQYKMMKDAK